MLLVALLLGLIFGVSYWYTANQDIENPAIAEEQEPQQEPVNEPTDVELEELPVVNGFRQFSGNEFRLFYDNLLQPDLLRVELPPEIYGNDEADTRIRQIAEARGYRLRSSPSITLPFVDGHQLHEAVHQPWLDMKAAATQDGLSMSIVSAYRSVEQQRQLFISRLNARGISVTDIVNGTADEQINDVLITSSIPGYSKHHTGYTIDLLCNGYAFENFKNSPCFIWLSARNYENAKKYGFIPSYPSDASLQGPDPEEWEYVWVGIDLLRI